MSTTAVMENERAVSPAGIRERLSGNEAVAIAIKQIHPDVFPAFPITRSLCHINFLNKIFFIICS